MRIDGLGEKNESNPVEITTGWFHFLATPILAMNQISRQSTLPSQSIAYGQVPHYPPFFNVCLRLIWEGTSHVADNPPSNGSCDACQSEHHHPPLLCFIMKHKSHSRAFFMLKHWEEATLLRCCYSWVIQLQGVQWKPHVNMNQDSKFILLHIFYIN